MFKFNKIVQKLLGKNENEKKNVTEAFGVSLLVVIKGYLYYVITNASPFR